MAAGKGQGRTLTVFLVGLTTACAGLAFIGSGGGKLALIIGLMLVIASFTGAKKLKPLEGKAAERPQPTGLRLLGLALAVGGWLIVIGGINLVSATGGRLAAVLLGIVVTLVGVLYFLPKASSQGAIWRA
jgi:hypothetical protein